MGDFMDSKEAELRRSVRQSIRSGPFTKGERDVTLAFFNHWFQNRRSGIGFVHPGRNKLAKRADTSIKTVTRTLEKLRLHGVIIAKSNDLGGGRRATRYAVSLAHLYDLCGKSKRDICPAVNRDISLNRGTNVPLKSGTKCPTDKGNIINLSSHEKTSASGGAA